MIILVFAFLSFITLLALKLALKVHKPSKQSPCSTICFLIASHTILQILFIRSALNKLYLLFPLSLVCFLNYFYPHYYAYCGIGILTIIIGRAIQLTKCRYIFVSIIYGSCSILFCLTGMFLSELSIQDEKSIQYGINVGLNMAIDQGIRIMTILVFGIMARDSQNIPTLIHICRGKLEEEKKNKIENKEESQANIMTIQQIVSVNKLSCIDNIYRRPPPKKRKQRKSEVLKITQNTDLKSIDKVRVARRPKRKIYNDPYLHEDENTKPSFCVYDFSNQ